MCTKALRRAERGGFRLRAGFFCCGAVRAAGWISVFVAGRCGLRARPVRAAGEDMSKYAGRAAGRMIQLRGGCELNVFSPRSLNSLKMCTLSVPISWWIT